MKKKILFIAGLSIIASSAMASDSIAVGITAGTLGAGIEGTTKITDNVNIRALLTGFKYSKDGSYGTDIDYDAKLKLFGAGVIADYYPIAGMRVSGGVIYNGTKIDLTGKPYAGRLYAINDRIYTSSQVGELNGEIKYQKMMPYIGLGFGNTMSGGKFTIGLDTGILIGKAKTKLTASKASDDPNLAADIAAEANKLDDEADRLKLYPVASISISYRF